jgi:hypothetical protein
MSIRKGVVFKKGTYDSPEGRSLSNLNDYQEALHASHATKFNTKLPPGSAGSTHSAHSANKLLSL